MEVERCINSDGVQTRSRSISIKRGQIPAELRQDFAPPQLPRKSQHSKTLRNHVVNIAKSPPEGQGDANIDAV